LPIPDDDPVKKPAETNGRPKMQRAKTIQVPKDIRDQLKKEILATLDKKETAQKTELSKKQTSDFVVQNYRSKNSMLTKSKSVKDLFEFDNKGMLILREQPCLL
jgi:hypothetical protein